MSMNYVERAKLALAASIDQALQVHQDGVVFASIALALIDIAESLRKLSGREDKEGDR